MSLALVIDVSKARSALKLGSQSPGPLYPEEIYIFFLFEGETLGTDIPRTRHNVTED